MISRVEARLPGIVVAVLGALFCLGALSYGVIKDGRMGPGLMPMVTGLGLVVLGTMIAVTARPTGRAVTTGEDVDHRDPRGGTRAAPTAPAGGVAAVEERTSEGAAPLPQEVRHPARPWLILAATASALVLAPLVGLIPGLGLMALVLLRFVEHESWRLTVAVTAGLIVSSWLVFEELLNLNLPWGFVGGLM